MSHDQLLSTAKLLQVASALEVQGLHFAYEGKPVLHDISFAVQAGTICGLLGPNGSGKSTLFKCCMNFLPYCRGSIIIKGQAIRTMPPSELAKHMAYVPQEHKQAFPFTVRELVHMGRTPHMGGHFGGMLRASSKDATIVATALECVGIEHLAEQPCNTLSGGQRQLVLIARALAQDTPIILLDEPTSALDFTNQVNVWNLLRHIASQGVAIVVCCHDPNHILWFCDQTVVLRNGRLLAAGAPRDVLSEETLQAIYGDTCRTTHVGALRMVYPHSRNVRL